MSETFNQRKKQVHGLLKRKLSILLSMSKIILFLLISICSLQLYSQTVKKSVIDEYKCVLFWSDYSFNLMFDETVYIINDSSFFTIIYKDSLINNITIEQFEIFHRLDTIKTAKSSYFNNKDTLSYYVYALNEDGILIGFVKRKYFQLLPNGEALFWNQKNKLRRRDYWDKGVLIKTENFE